MWVCLIEARQYFDCSDISVAYSDVVVCCRMKLSRSGILPRTIITMDRIFLVCSSWVFLLPLPVTVGPLRYSLTDCVCILLILQFNGVYRFQYPITELEKHVPSLDGMEVMITATVGERFLDEVITAYSVARVFNSSVQVNFLGGSPQVFKPAMPFSAYVRLIFVL